MKIKELLETSSSGSTGSGSIASVASPLGGAYAPVVRRMAAHGQSFFAPIAQDDTKKRKKKLKRG